MKIVNFMKINKNVLVVKKGIFYRIIKPVFWLKKLKIVNFMILVRIQQFVKNV